MALEMTPQIKVWPRKLARLQKAGNFLNKIIVDPADPNTRGQLDRNNKMETAKWQNDDFDQGLSSQIG